MNNRGRTQLVDLGKFEITLDQQVISYSLRRSFKANLIWLNIKGQSGLTVTIPHCYNIKDLPDYLNINSHWILRNLKKYYRNSPEGRAAVPNHTDSVPYLGRCLKVMQKRRVQGCTAVKLDPTKSIVNLNLGKGKFAAAELERWLKEQADLLINVKVRYFGDKMGLLYNRVTIRDQKSRWGSCSCRRNLNFNWRLIMAPEPVLDYVIIHELCHLKEMSHSRSFWFLVAEYCPHWHEHRTWLDSHSLELNSSFK